MRFRLILAVGLALILASSSVLAGKPFDHQHKAFQQILQSYVKDGKVDYAGLKLAHKKLDKYIDSLGDVSEKRYAGFTRNQKLAYWLNFYNACLLEAVSSNLDKVATEGTRSPRQIPGLWTAFKWETPFGRRTLNSMEFDFLRDFRKVMWPTAVSRGTTSGGYLRSHAYTGSNVKDQIRSATRQWIGMKSNFEVDVEKKTLRVSKYLLHFMPDFKGEFMNRGEFMGRTEQEQVFANIFLKFGTNSDAKAMIRKGDFTLVALPKDDTLNEFGAAR
ncbi:MAG: DUF547 domain-containing protein [Candidatus Lernaella stagnicola]|nr:DUF547 domain-containing protein [Candidatus Lernaella stagnicola]